MDFNGARGGRAGGRRVILATVVLVLLLVGAAILALLAIGAARWQAGTAVLRRRLAAQHAPGVAALATDGLPAPVAAYLRAVLAPGQAPIAAVRLAHRGSFDLGTARPRWKPFRSDQRVIVHPPGFDWDARIFVAPGLAVHVHDAYIGGEGLLTASLAGLKTVAHQRGAGDLAQGELLRFLAEAAWYPTALAGPGVRWAPIDARNARATLVDGAVTATLTFHFGANGLLERVHAEARGRTVGETSVPTPWQGRFWNYTRHGGMLVPEDGEVAWLLPGGERPYWRGHIERVAYTFAGADAAGA